MRICGSFHAGGPSCGKLQAGDEIVRIDSHPVESSSQCEVVDLLRSVYQQVNNAVCWPRVFGDMGDKIGQTRAISGNLVRNAALFGTVYGVYTEKRGRQQKAWTNNLRQWQKPLIKMDKSTPRPSVRRNWLSAWLN